MWCDTSLLVPDRLDTPVVQVGSILLRVDGRRRPQTADVVVPRDHEWPVGLLRGSETRFVAPLGQAR